MNYNNENINNSEQNETRRQMVSTVFGIVNAQRENIENMDHKASAEKDMILAEFWDILAKKSSRGE